MYRTIKLFLISKLKSKVFYFFRLFNIIVDSDKTGSLVLQHINKMRLPGEVTFMPLNKLKFRDLNYPSSPVSVVISKPMEQAIQSTD